MFKRYITSVAVSIDSLDDLQNKQLKRPPANIVIEKIKLLIKSGVCTVLTSTITKINIDQIESLIDLSKDLAVRELKINDFVLDGRSIRNKDHLILSSPLESKTGDIKNFIKKSFGTSSAYYENFVVDVVTMMFSLPITVIFILV